MSFDCHKWILLSIIYASFDHFALSKVKYHPCLCVLISMTCLGSKTQILIKNLITSIPLCTLYKIPLFTAEIAKPRWTQISWTLWGVCLFIIFIVVVMFIIIVWFIFIIIIIWGCCLLLIFIVVVMFIIIVWFIFIIIIIWGCCLFLVFIMVITFTMFESSSFNTLSKVAACTILVIWYLNDHILTILSARLYLMIIISIWCLNYHLLKIWIAC